MLPSTTFVQSDLSVTKYCHKFKGMADALDDLGSPVDDQILILNILHGFNQRFEHLGAIIRHSSPFPNFLKVRDDLILEEIHLDTAAPTALYTSTAPPAPKPQPSASSRPPNSNNIRRNGDNGGGNSGKNSSSGRGGNSGNTTAASIGSTSNDDRTTSPWSMYVNPWQGHIAMYPGPVPTGRRPQAFLSAPGHYTPPGFVPE
jgi:hypothetical protein